MDTDQANGATGGGEWQEDDSLRLRYRDLVEFAPDAYLITDAQGLVVEANHAAAVVLRCPKEFLIGKPLGLFLATGYRPRFYECLARLHAGTEVDEFETRVGRRDGLRTVIVRVSPVDPGAGWPHAFRWMIRDITEFRSVEAARDRLLRSLVTAQEDERRRVARELHDSVGQLLSALLLGIRAVRDSGPLPPTALARLDEVQRVADELGRATHDLAIRLRPTALDDLGLPAALQQLLQDWTARTGISVQFQAVGMDSERLPLEVETALYRVIQEALTNVLKHASAGLVSVVVERQDGRAIAVVEDDGVGFDPEAVALSGRLGLLGMKERVALLGGHLEVESSPGSGTTVLARIPLTATPEDGPRAVPPAPPIEPCAAR